MGGSIWFHSQVGVGSTFYFTLRVKGLSQYDETSKSISLKRRISSDQSRSLKVLLAEDNAINQVIMKRIFDKLGCQVSLVSNGNEAVNLVQKEDFDAIFMDLQMPEMGGLDATRIILKMDWSKRMRPKIVAVTSAVTPEDKFSCLQAGMDFHLSKPLKVDEIRQVCDCLIKGKKFKQFLSW